jgi:dihydroorotase
MNPPLRTADDVAALQQAVKTGVIDVIATDHAPHHYDEKEREFADAPNGIVGFETALAVNITWLVKSKIIDLATLVDRMSCAPAKIFHLPGGSLRKGSAADVTIFDPAEEWKVDASKFRTKGRNTPYQGMTLAGRVHYTLVHGRLTHRVSS